MKIPNIPTYTADELVRLEILSYENPEGLHPIESAWRDIARKLIEHCSVLQNTLIELNKLSGYNKIDNLSPFKFPKRFTPNDKHE